MPLDHARAPGSAIPATSALPAGRAFEHPRGAAPAGGHSFGEVAVNGPAPGSSGAIPLQARLDRQRSERPAQALQAPGRGKPLPAAVQAKMEAARAPAVERHASGCGCPACCGGGGSGSGHAPAPDMTPSPGGSGVAVQAMETPASPTPFGRSQPLEVRPSQIHGKGLFAKGRFHPGEPIEVGATARAGADGRQEWQVTPGARYTNHHDTPNAKLTTSGGKLMMSAGRAIRPDEEVTVDYDEVGQRIGDGHLTWRGKTVPSGPEAEAFYRNDRA